MEEYNGHIVKFPFPSSLSTNTLYLPATNRKVDKHGHWIFRNLIILITKLEIGDMHSWTIFGRTTSRILFRMAKKQTNNCTYM